jgi:hypothetical protein
MTDSRYDHASLLQRVADLAARFAADLPDRQMGARENTQALVERLRVPFPAGPEDPIAVIERLARDVEGGLVSSAGPRYFGFVTGASLPAALAADWLRFGDDDAKTRDVIDAVQREGVAWMGGTVWRGKAAMRISVSGWSTREGDIDRTAESILRAAN